MRTFGIVLFWAGLAAFGVGLLGLFSILLQRLGVAFDFRVRPWYGPFLGAILFLIAGRVVRRQFPVANSPVP